jgi:hypothetical protein
MNANTTIKIAVAAATIAAVVVYPKLSKNATLTKLTERYPEIDPKIAKAAYKSMMSDAISGKLDCSNWSEERFNQLFLMRVAALQNPFTSK